MKRFKRILSWIAERLKDAFYDTDNEHLDLARVLAFLAIMGELVALRHNIKLKAAIDLGPGGLGGGLAAILTAAAGYLAAKAWSKKKNRESAAVAQNIAVAKEAHEPVAGSGPAATAGNGPTPVTVMNPPSDPVPTTEAKP